MIYHHHPAQPNNHHPRPDPDSVLSHHHPHPAHLRFISPPPLPKAKKVKVGARASIACGTCRRRKVRCSGKYPICGFCAARNLRCDYDGHPDVDSPLSNSTLWSSSSSSKPQPRKGLSELSSLNRPDHCSGLPTREIIKDVVQLFFIHFGDEGLLAFFHRPTLTHQIESDSVQLEILFSILCLAGRFCESLKTLHFNDFRQTCNFYANQALKCIEINPYEISISRIHVNLMLGFHYCTEHEEKRGWMHIGAATRMSQLLNLGQLDDHPHQPIQNLTGSNHLDEPPRESIHGSPITHANTSPSQSPISTDQFIIQHDIKRRSFWACFLIERLFGDGKERPVMIHPEDDCIITRFPIPDDHFLTGKQAPTAKFGTTQSPPWSPGLSNHPSGTFQANDSSPQEIEADIFGQTMRISELWYQVFKYVSNGGRNKDRRCPWLCDSTFGQIDERLSEWESSLPLHLQYSETNMITHTIAGSGKFYGLMHLLYFTSLLYLHRDYIPFLPPLTYHPKDGPIDGEPLWEQGGNLNPPNPDWWQTSAETCFKSAKAVTDLFVKLDHHGNRLIHPFAGFSILTAATMHLHLWFWPRSSSEIQNAGEYLALDTGILENFKKYWYFSDHWCRALNAQYTLNSLIQQVGHHTPLISPPSLLRAGLMKIINSQINDSPTHVIASSSSNTAERKVGGLPTGKSATKHRGEVGVISDVETIASSIGSSKNKGKTDDNEKAGEDHDCSLEAHLLLNRTYDVFSQKWPEPQLSNFQITHSLTGVNHRRQQLERQRQEQEQLEQKQIEQDREQYNHEKVNDLISTHHLEFTTHSSLGDSEFSYHSKQDDRSKSQLPSQSSHQAESQCRQNSPAPQLTIHDCQSFENHEHHKSSTNLVPNLIRNDWNSINFLSQLPVFTTAIDVKLNPNRNVESSFDWPDLNF